MRIFLIGFCLASLFAQHAPAQQNIEPSEAGTKANKPSGQPGEKPSAAAIKKWISDLDSRNFKTRSIAEARLLKSGTAGEKALLNVIAQTKSLDLSQRAKKLVEQIRQQTLDRITQAARQATAVIEAPGRNPRLGGIGRPAAKPNILNSAFCIDSSGVFVTTYYAVRYAKTATIPLTVNPGMPNQKTFKAKVMRYDVGANTAILMVDANRTFASIPLASAKGVSELVAVFAVGSVGQKTTLAGKPQYPAVSAMKGFVCSIITAGNSVGQMLIDIGRQAEPYGGPLLNDQGQVIGVMAGRATITSSRRPSTNITQLGATAIPAEMLGKMFLKPLVKFMPPALTPKTVSQPCEFAVKIIHLSATAKPKDISLLLASDGAVRRHKMTNVDGVYRVKATPIATPQKPATVRAKINLPNGCILVALDDQTLQIGKRNVKLSELRSLVAKQQTVAALLFNGMKLEGPLTGATTLSFELGGAKREIDLQSISSLTIEPVTRKIQVMCRVVASDNGVDQVLWEEVLPVQSPQAK